MFLHVNQILAKRQDPNQPVTGSTGNAQTDEFLKLIADPFTLGITQSAFLISLATSLGITAAITLAFCLIRPYQPVVYAPRLKHADEKHAPPPISKGIFAWLTPVRKTKEDELIEKVGLDAAIFLRFTRMCRNIFLVLTIVGCGIIIPVNVLGGREASKTFMLNNFIKMTPTFLYGRILWAFVFCAYLFTFVVFVFLWINYRAVRRLRRNYFESPEYKNSLHSRTLMITEIPPNSRSDEGVVRIVDSIKQTQSIPQSRISRNVKDLPELIGEHEKAVRALESVLAKYLKDPDHVPSARPTCKPSKKDRGYAGSEKIDAIDYYTHRIKSLEFEIKQVRKSVDQRNAMAYGFASYENIEEAHAVAYAARGKHPDGTTVKLAPKPNDLIWMNLALTPKDRRWKHLVVNLWVTLLIVVWVVPNAMIALFLSNLANLGKVWPAFQENLTRNPKTWAAVQGIAAPAITSLFYFYLPAIFRRLNIRAGDTSKSSREKHVVHKLYNFFIFNNLLVFSLFAAVWSYVAAVIQSQKADKSGVWDALQKGEALVKIVQSLCNVSPFWITWLLQRNLGAAIDLSQLVNLAWGSFARKVMNPTPRQMIEWSAPPPFDYASYYNYFLFYTAIALCFGTLQPVVIPVTAFFFSLDSVLKKYLLLYVFTTKNESGGQMWRVLYNRMLISVVISNLVIAVVVAAKSYDSRIMMLAAMAPLILIIGGFKWYCARTFDDDIHFYARSLSKDVESDVLPDRNSRRKDKLRARYGNPALYRPLLTPMVYAKSQHLLSQIYRGRLNSDDTTAMGYGDAIHMQNMSKQQGGKSSAKGPFEFVEEGDLDFEHYKNRPEFREQFGGEGEMYGYAPDMSRPSSPGMSSDRGRSSSRGSSRAGSPYSRSQSRHGVDMMGGTTYPTGYHQTHSMARNYSPDRSSFVSTDTGMQRPYSGSGYEVNLIRGAAPMAGAASGRPDSPGRQLWPQTPTGPTPYRDAPGEDDEMSYDYFRRGRAR